MNLMQILDVEKSGNLNIGAVVLKAKSQTRSSLTWAVLERKVLRSSGEVSFIIFSLPFPRNF